MSSDSPGALAIAPPAATRVLCRPPRMKDEEAFLSRLERVTRFRFVGGRLGLDYGDGELLFEAATPAPGAS